MSLGVHLIGIKDTVGPISMFFSFNQFSKKRQNKNSLLGRGVFHGTELCSNVGGTRSRVDWTLTDLLWESLQGLDRT